MDVDHDNGLESFEDDDVHGSSHNTSTILTPVGSASGREPLSKKQIIFSTHLLYYYSSR